MLNESRDTIIVISYLACPIHLPFKDNFIQVMCLATFMEQHDMQQGVIALKLMLLR